MSAELIKMPYRLRCDISRCSNRAEYSIGNPESSKATHFHICVKCLKHFVDSLPDEFKPVKIVEVEPEKMIETKTVQDGLETLGDLLTESLAEEGPEEKPEEKTGEKPAPEVKKPPVKKKPSAKKKTGNLITKYSL